MTRLDELVAAEQQLKMHRDRIHRGLVITSAEPVSITVSGDGTVALYVGMNSVRLTPSVLESVVAKLNWLLREQEVQG